LWWTEIKAALAQPCLLFSINCALSEAVTAACM